MKILIRCPNWVGDIVMASPVFRCIRENFPTAEITAAVRKYAAGVLDECPHFNSLLIIEDKGLKGVFNLSKQISKSNYDKAVLLTNSPHAFFPVYFGNVREIYAYRRNLQRFFVKGPYPLMENGRIKPLPMTEYYLEICRFMGLDLPKKIQTELFVSAEAEKEIEKIFNEKGLNCAKRVICINPGAKFGSSKCWPPANFAKLAGLAALEFAAKIILVSGPGEEKIASEIISKSDVEIIHLGNINLSRLKALVKRVSLLITNDTGPRHYATAFNVPSVVILGPTDIAYTDYARDITSFVSVELDCAPCHLKNCPRDHACMIKINPEMVLEHMRRFLDGGGAPVIS